MKKRNLWFPFSQLVTLILAAATFCLATTLSATVIMNYSDGENTHSPSIVGSGRVVSETRPVSGFHGLAQQIDGKVIITQGDSEGLVVEGEDNILPLIECRVDKAGILHLGIKTQGGRISFDKELVFKLQVKRLDTLEVQSSADVQGASLSGDHFEVRLLGSGQVTFDHLEVQSLTADILGSGTAKLAGITTSQTLHINGSGDYEGRVLKTQDTQVEVNGSGRATVWADRLLDVSIHGAGEVGFCGTAKPTKSLPGSGKVYRLADRQD